MCGICGKYNYKNSKPVSAETLKAMSDQMVLRGPDEGSVYVDGNFGFGFRRLSIIDVEGGHQPISNETNDIWLIANGEIYNYNELRSRLKARGHRFKTKTDVEVILHCYEDFGTDCFEMLRGMFGIGIWDKREKKLVLARDGVGIKPLYYSVNGPGVVFASELKAMFADPDMEFDLDYSALNYYFTFNYIPEPLSIFQSVKKLMPGHYLVSKKDGVFIKKYWDVRIAERPEAADAELFLEKFEDAVKSQLVSDVPVGAFLSGGVDSSAVCYFYNKHYQAELHTFSVGFREESYSELPYARNFAKFLGTNHHSIYVDETITSWLPELVSYFDEPFGDSSMVPVFFVSKLAREYVKVVLVGDGADELLAGYETYIADRLLRVYQRVPARIRGIIDGFIKSLPPSFKKVSLEEKLKRFVQFASLNSNVSSHALWRCIFDAKAIEGLLREDILAEIEEIDVLEQYHSTVEKYALGETTNDFCFLDFKNYLPADMLVKVDRMTMMNSLEARPPFLDQEFVKYVFSIPSEFKLRGLTTKYLMKKALDGLLPGKTVYRAKKGFNVPVSDWFMGALKDLLLEHIHAESGAHQIVRRETVLELLNRHDKRVADHGYQLWNILVFYIWYQNVYAKLARR